MLFTVSYGQDLGARYLIITNDAYYNQVIALAQWKYRKGMRSKIVKLSEIGADSTAIKSYVADAYNTWQVKPEYLLLVGAPNYLPFPIVADVHSDNYYTNTIGTIFNDILSGRLTVHNTTEAQTVINKILAYEERPNRMDTSWFNKASLISRMDGSQSDSIYWSDIAHMAALMIQSGFSVIDTFINTHGDNDDSVINAVNAGRSIVVYRGSATNNWYEPFNVNADLTANGTRLPIVLSMTCFTLGTSATPAMAEKWFLTGSPANLRGAAGYFATSTGSTAYYRSALTKGFFDALFVDQKSTFGECCEKARKRVYPLNAAEYLGFTTIGDPEMNLWTATPCSIIVQYPESVTYAYASVPVFIKRAADLTPISDACVCLTGGLDSAIYYLDSTDMAGFIRFDIYPHILRDTIYITVTGENLQPYEGFMIVKHAVGSYVIYKKSFIDDSLGGNHDHIINPGEDINLPTWVENFGDSSSINTVGCLRTNDEFIAPYDSVRAFGDIAAFDSACTGDSGYRFNILPDCPDCHIINCTLICRDTNNNTWSSYFEKQVHAADLVYQYATIAGGNGNNSFECGETVSCMVTIKNQGSAAIDSVTACLRSLSPYIDVIDSSGSFDHIGPDSSACNGSDLFILCSDPGTPPMTYVDMQMNVSAGYCNDTLDFSILVGKGDYFIWNPDHTPASGENIHLILQDLGYIGDHDSTLPQDLNKYKSIFVCCGVYPNNHIILNGSPQASALSDFIIYGGCAYLEGGDVWYYDPHYNNGFDFSPLFDLLAMADGNNNMGPIQGQAGSFASDMDFEYAGENQYMDHLGPDSGGGFVLFLDSNDNFNCGIAYDAGPYQTIGSSFELGFLVDSTPPSTRSALLDSIMHFFGRSVGIAEYKLASHPREQRFEVFPNPARTSMNLRVTASEKGKVAVILYDVVGRVIIRKFKIEAEPGVKDYRLDLKGISSGIYFLRFETTKRCSIHKIILLK
ncbi:MAG TPA: C25 family cysteine peptidase [bacterium]